MKWKMGKDWPVAEQSTREGLEEKPGKAKERLEKYGGYRKYMEGNGLSQMPLMDWDAESMRDKDGYQVSYNVQTSVDSGTHMVPDY